MSIEGVIEVLIRQEECNVENMKFDGFKVFNRKGGYMIYNKIGYNPVKLVKIGKLICGTTNQFEAKLSATTCKYLEKNAHVFKSRSIKLVGILTNAVYSSSVLFDELRFKDGVFVDFTTHSYINLFTRKWNGIYSINNFTNIHEIKPKA